jgi:TraM recognition site of TraD and TraG
VTPLAEGLWYYAIPAAAAWAVARKLRGKKRASGGKDWLDDALFTWPDSSPYSVRHALTSVQVKGITGSGKTSGSGRYIIDAMAKHPRSTFLFITQKPEDKEFFGGILLKHKKPFVVLEKGGQHRCNLLDTQRLAGSDSRGLVEFLMTLGQALDGGQERTSDPFWKKLEERIFYNAIEALKLGTGRVSAPDLLDFIASAPYKPEDMKDEKWLEGLAPKVIAEAFERPKNRIEEADYKLLESFWTKEFPTMDDKPRSSGLAGVMNTLHTFNTGLVRDICSTGTTITPAVMEQGVSVIVNFPVSEDGPTGRFIAGGFKYLWQKHVLRRHWNQQFFNVMVLDEYQESATEFDARYLAQCRSHGGAMFCLTQTIHSEYATMSGHGHHHRADQLLSNFGTHIYHTVDSATAKFASDLLGQHRESFVSFSQKPDMSVTDEIFGNAGMSSSFSESYQPQLQPHLLTTGLRNGGPENRYIVDGVVIRLGVPFRNGLNYQVVNFSQKG